MKRLKYKLRDVNYEMYPIIISDNIMYEIFAPEWNGVFPSEMVQLEKIEKSNFEFAASYRINV